MALTLADLLDHEKRSTPTPDSRDADLYDPRGFGFRRRSSTTKRPPVSSLTDFSPRIDIPGAAGSATPPSPGAQRRLSRPPELSASPDVPEGSSGSEVETPSQVLSRSLDARLQFDLSPGMPKLEGYFSPPPSEDPIPVSPLPALQSRDSGATIVPSESDGLGYVRSHWRYSKAGLSLGQYATAPAEPGIPSSRFANLRGSGGRRDSSNESSVTSSRSPSDSMACSPAQAYLSSFSRGTSMQSLDEVDAPKEVIQGYAIGKAIGFGGFSSVREAQHIESGKKVAVKVLPARPLTAAPSLARSRTMSTPPAYEALSFPNLGQFPEENQQATALDHEVKIWSRLAAHPHILPLLDLQTTLEASYIFMPFCSSGNLLQYIQEYAKRGRRRREQSPVGSNVPQRASSLRRIISPAEEPSDPGGGGFDLNHARHIFAQIVDGLRYLHIEAEVTHKDIKLENILLDDKGFFRIADFGLAVSRTSIEHPRAHSMIDPKPQDLASSWHGFPKAGTGDDVTFFGMVPLDSPHLNAQLGRSESTKQMGSKLSTKSSVASMHTKFAAAPAKNGSTPATNRSAPAGSLAYAAPELLSLSPNTYSAASPAVDMWALGCVLYALLDGRLPFVDEFEPRLRVKILEGQWTVPAILLSKDYQHGFSLDGDSSEQCEAVLEVLNGCLEPDPLKRWTIEQVRDSAWLATRWPSMSAGEHHGENTRNRSKGRRSQSRSGSRGRSKSRPASRERTSRERTAPY